MGRPLPKPFLGTASIDRLRHGAYKVVLEGKIFRRMKSNTENKKSRKKKAKKVVAKGGGKR